MPLRFIHSLLRRSLMGSALWLLLAVEVMAAPLRVTTWSMQPKTVAEQANGVARLKTNRVQDAAAVLKKLDPDVIILQQVENWQSCDELVKALRPTNYNLMVCSSFRDKRTGALSRQQVAILAKAKPYISWSEAWKGNGQMAAAPGGFAFAALRLEKKNVGFFSVQLGDAALPGTEQQSVTQQQGREESARQMLQQIAALQNWTANRIEALVVAGDFNTSLDNPQLADEKTLRLLDESGLANAFSNVPANQRITFPGNDQRADATFDYIFTRNAGLVATPTIFTTAWAEHYPVTCDLDLNAPKQAPAAVPVARVELPPVNTPKLSAAQTSPVLSAAPVVVQAALPASPGYNNAWWLAGAVSGGVLLVLLVWRLARRTRVQPANAPLLAMKVESGASISVPTDAGQIVITHRSAETTGSAANRPTIVHVEAQDSSQTQSQAWQRRAEEAEQRARRANMVMRAGLMPHLSRWLKEKLVQKLVSDRTRLMETQRAAALKLLAVDDRLSRIESQLQQRNQDYEQRIDELMKELAEAQEENRELIRAKITLVKVEMERERARQSEHRAANTER